MYDRGITRAAPEPEPISRQHFLEGVETIETLLNERHFVQGRQALRTLGVERIVVTADADGKGWSFERTPAV